MTCLYGWIANVRTCIEQRKKHGKHRQNVYADTSQVVCARQAACLIGGFVDACRSGTLNRCHCYMNLLIAIRNRAKHRTFYMSRGELSFFAWISSLNYIFKGIDSEWFKKFVRVKL